MRLAVISSGLSSPGYAHDCFPGGVSERSKVPDSKSGVVKATGGSNPPPSASLHVSWVPVADLEIVEFFGEVTERPKVHDWKSCVVKATEGSNPSLSARALRFDLWSRVAQRL